MDFTQAIVSLYPDATWSMNGDLYENLWWSDENEDPKPTKEELKKQASKLKREAKKKAYIDQRASEYPSAEEQLDMLWHMMDSGEIPGAEGEWYKKILEIKEKYPK